MILSSGIVPFLVNPAEAQKLIKAGNKNALSRTIKWGDAPSYLRPGDLAFCEIRDILVLFGGHDVAPDKKHGFDHVALYCGKGHVNMKGEFIEDDKHGIDHVIEATCIPGNKVRYTPLFLLKIYSHVTYGKVNGADEAIRRGTLDFARSQLGQPYQHFWKLSAPFNKHANWNPDDLCDPYSDWYYCAELVWASYYSQGIDIDPIFPEDLDKDGNPDIIEGYGYLRFVSPKNIFDSENTTSY